MPDSIAHRPARDTVQPGRLLLIRHAEVEERYQNVFGGQIDMELSPEGHEQALKLAAALRRNSVSAIYSSPMKRVQQTLAPFVRESGLRQEILPALREVHFGDWTGLNWEEVGERFGIHPYDWLDEIQMGRVPNGETGMEFRARVEPSLDRIIGAHPAQTVAVFSHGGVIRMILSTLLGLPLPKTNQFEIEYASITRIALHRHMNEIELLNFVPWRDMAG
ncbi:MAG: phosphoglycerate mutase family protein [Verrucomicrobia bacterium]|nr:phosphoglycerate mutase family protein [Verrucomicrobiota bacterium]MDE3099650.1 histidine phosphatase family protein [Verrucomicrobiota bacterium]